MTLIPSSPAHRPQRLALQHPQAQDRRLTSRKPLQQADCGYAEAFDRFKRFACRSGERVQQVPLIGTLGIEAVMAPRMDALLVLTAGAAPMAPWCANPLLSADRLSPAGLAGGQGAAEAGERPEHGLRLAMEPGARFLWFGIHA